MDLAPWAIALFTVIVVYFLDRWENKYIKSIFDWVPAILLAYLIPAGISFALGLDLSQAKIHDYSKDFFIPLTIVSVMASLSLGQLKAIGYKPIVLFVAGSFFVALFPVVFVMGFSETNLVSETLAVDGFWKGIPPVVGSWIGGSTSQLVLKELVECPEAIFLSVLVMDNILVNIWTILMFQGIKKSNKLNTWFKITDKGIPEEIREEKQKPLQVWMTIVILLAIVFVTNYFVESFVGKVVLLSIIGLALGNFIPKWNFKFSLRAGAILILVVMAILGLKLQFDTLGFDVSFFGFLVIWLLGHFFFMVLIAKLMNVNMAWVPIASMANVGGIATAPAVTAAYEKKWMPHAIVLAILSMATGTFWGMLTIYLLKIVI
ncbi:hypothetical protein DKG77_03865 [Flagellimonas aquimarina]|jgi:uncharacterized membrane protein|uniref:DUF819 family protein n=1 Tax=Flagellimonas aquimarina TaxID=2201895 RepID=A0A316L1L5_9FLAO|nr:DUF819 family protein [Allomuricauda koreensis]PWL39974.1 hypothetical protein DKG77_03865 [Allomuricauda koreensis]